MEISPIINEYAMSIRSEFMDKICMVGLDTKIYPKKIEAGRYVVETMHFMITNIYNMLHPQFGYQDYKKDTSIDKYIQDFRKENKLVVPYYRIKPIFNKKLLVTLKCGSTYYEIICNCVCGENLWFLWIKCDSEFNETACQELQLKYNYDECDIDGNHYTHYVKIPQFVELLSIEVLGFHQKETQRDDMHSWLPDGKDSYYHCNIDYESKTITSGISRSEATGRGHRTSNGWKETIIEYGCHMWRQFDTRKEMNDFLANLPNIFKEAKIEITDNGNKSSLNIQFPEPIEESRFIDRFGFSAEGWHGYAD